MFAAGLFVRVAGGPGERRERQGGADLLPVQLVLRPATQRRVKTKKQRAYWREPTN